jgi:Protein of unknown function (DUF2721)
VDGQRLDSLTAAVAPVVMVSAAGLLFNGVQAKNLHLSDRIRALAAEMRHPDLTPTRRMQVLRQLTLFHTRIRLSQWSLDCIYLAILCFILTSLLLASTLWIGPPVLPALTTGIFLLGVAVLVVALGLEFVEMAIALKTIEIEIQSAMPSAAPRDAGAAHGLGKIP